VGEKIMSEHKSNIISVEKYVPKKGEEYMNDNQRKHLEKILMAWRQSLMEKVDDTVSQMKDEAANFPDPNDRASQEEEFSIELRTRDRERKLIKKIEESLEQLWHEDFGYCETCGIEIGFPRLEARPTATLCIDCKTLAEIKEKQVATE
jgi:DnaK suppressor protein